MTKSIKELIEDLGNDDEFIQEEARTLLESNQEESLESLIDALLNNKNKNVKISAAKVLGFIGGEKVIDPLINALHDNNKLVRREASTALSKMGNEAVDPLIQTLNDDNWRVKGAAAWALGNIGNKKALDPLNDLLTDKSAFVKTGAKWAISNINKND